MEVDWLEVNLLELDSCFGVKFVVVFFFLLKSVIRLSVGIQYLAARARSSADILNSPHQGETPPS